MIKNDNQPCIDKTPMMLINDISRMFGAQMRRCADELGIPSGYRHMLIYLAHNDGVSQLELAKFSHLTPPTVSVTLQKMERDGFIERRADSADQRQMLVYITEKGKRLEMQSKMKADETEKLALDRLGEQERAQLREYLSRIYDGMRTFAPHPCELPPRKD